MLRPAAVTYLLVALLLATAGAAAATVNRAARQGGDAARGQGAQAEALASPRAPRGGAVPQPAPAASADDSTAVAEEEAPRAARPRGFEYLKVRPGRSVALRASPGGAVAARVGSRTEFGSQTVLSVADRRGDWLGVVSSALPNGRLGWVRADRDSTERGRTLTSIQVDLSTRSLALRRGRKVVRRIRVSVGRPGSSTPTGRFAVTDRLSGASYGSYYGCCILALTGHQPNTPAGWRGGDRLAIHGTNAPGSIGAAASAGCLRALDADLELLMRRVPLGAPVVVRP
ncbi:MAG TPA: L,D-transpeptidase [Thermoleophilaceae bacterium]|jgi:hypothetical protein